MFETVFVEPAFVHADPAIVAPKDGAVARINEVTVKMTVSERALRCIARGYLSEFSKVQ
jgi:hypothetical protein